MRSWTKGQPATARVVGRSRPGGVASFAGREGKPVSAGNALYIDAQAENRNGQHRQPLPLHAKQRGDCKGRERGDRCGKNVSGREVQTQRSDENRGSDSRLGGGLPVIGASAKSREKRGTAQA